MSMLAEPSSYQHPVKGEGDTIIQHDGWALPPHWGGWQHTAPSAVLCRACGDRRVVSVLTLVGVTVVGGRHTLIWHLECETEGCGHQIDFPATETGDGR